MVKLWIDDLFAHMKQYGLCFLTSTISICLVLVVSMLSNSVVALLNQEFSKLGLQNNIVQLLSSDYSQTYLNYLLHDEKYTMLFQKEFGEVIVISCQNLREFFPYEIMMGEDFEYLDNFKNCNEVLLGKNAYAYFLQPKIGEIIQMSGCEFTVKGVLEENQSNLLFDFDNCIITNQFYDFDNQTVYLLANASFNQEKIMNYFGKENVILLNDNQLNKTISKFETIIKVVFNVLSLFSFFVSGLGLLNFQKAILKTRKNEIGIKKSLGAKPRDILIQFLFESVLINLLALGTSLLLVGIINQNLNTLFQANFLLSVSNSVITILIISVLIGLYPAYKASKVSIIEAIRY